MSFKISEEKRAALRFKRQIRKRKKRKALTYSGNITLYTDIKKDNIGNKKECVFDSQDHIETGSENK